MKMKTFLVTFTPTGRFYFGSSKSFAEGFHAISLRFPTPQTVLGCLRRTMLHQNGLLDATGRFPQNNNGKNFHDYTGKSIGTDLFEHSPDLGKIRSISPVFIVHKRNTEVNDYLLPVPHDVIRRKLEVVNGEDHKCLGTSTPFTNEGNGETTIWEYGVAEFEQPIKLNRSGKDVMMAYSNCYKESPFDALGGSLFWNEYVKSSPVLTPDMFHTASTEPINEEKGQVFFPERRPGIARERGSRVALDEYFYIEESFRMADEYSFGVLLYGDEELLNGEKRLLSDDFVVLGGNRSLFRMEVNPFEDNAFDGHPVMKQFISNLITVQKREMQHKTVLLSPFLTHHQPLPAFAYGRVYGKENFRTLNYKNNKPGGLKSDSIIAYRAGSVLYMPAESSDHSEVQETLAMRLGFNQFLTI